MTNAPMNLQLTIGNASYTVRYADAINLAIPLDFYGEQPNAYDVPAATAKTFENAMFIGDTRRGGSCNFETYTLTPHCNGTHTECIGHLANDRIHINSVFNETLIPATVITISPENAQHAGERYIPPPEPNDRLISRRQLAVELKSWNPDFRQALVIRTAPNDLAKKSMRYSAELPLYFSLDAMHYLNELGVRHLLVDFPSLDRANDEGKLSAHRLFWGIEPETHDIKTVSEKTVTEMIYVPSTVDDGIYLLNLQVAPFMSDAAPSRPMLLPLKRNP
jgi:arylformamidase